MAMRSGGGECEHTELRCRSAVSFINRRRIFYGCCVKEALISKNFLNLLVVTQWRFNV